MAKRYVNLEKLSPRGQATRLPVSSEARPVARTVQFAPEDKATRPRRPNLATMRQLYREGKVTKEQFLNAGGKVRKDGKLYGAPRDKAANEKKPRERKAKPRATIATIKGKAIVRELRNRGSMTASQAQRYADKVCAIPQSVIEARKEKEARAKSAKQGRSLSASEIAALGLTPPKKTQIVIR